MSIQRDGPFVTPSCVQAVDQAQVNGVDPQLRNPTTSRIASLDVGGAIPQPVRWFRSSVTSSKPLAWASVSLNAIQRAARISPGPNVWPPRGERDPIAKTSSSSGFWSRGEDTISVEGVDDVQPAAPVV